MNDDREDTIFKVVEGKRFTELLERVVGLEQAVGTQARQSTEVAERVGSISETLEQMAARSRLSSRDRDRKLEAINNSLARLSDVVEGLCSKQELLEAASRQQERLVEEHYRGQVIKPVALQLIQLLDHIEDYRRHDSSGNGRPPASLLDAFHTHLLETLARFGIEPIECDSGATLDPGMMEPVKDTPASQGDRVGDVAEVLRHGFRFSDGQVVRYSRVSIFRPKDPAEPVTAGKEQ